MTSLHCSFRLFVHIRYRYTKPYYLLVRDLHQVSLIPAPEVFLFFTKCDLFCLEIKTPITVSNYFYIYDTEIQSIITFCLEIYINSVVLQPLSSLFFGWRKESQKYWVSKPTLGWPWNLVISVKFRIGLLWALVS